MAKPAKYTSRRMVRMTEEMDQKLIERSKIMKLAPAVVLRIIVEHSLNGKPIKPVEEIAE